MIIPHGDFIMYGLVSVRFRIDIFIIPGLFSVVLILIVFVADPFPDTLHILDGVGA